MPDPGGAPIYGPSPRAELRVVDREVEGLWLDLRTPDPAGRPGPHANRATNHVLASAGPGRQRCRPPRDVARHGQTGPHRPSPPILASPAVEEDRPTTRRRNHTITGRRPTPTSTRPGLWPIRETKRKCARHVLQPVCGSWTTTPEYRFTCSQAVQYQWMKDGYPALYERIKQRVKEGRWEPVGGMWVEADTNVPSGESLVRQLVHGKRFFLDEFGIESSELWIPDVFGYFRRAASDRQPGRRDGLRHPERWSWNGIKPFPASHVFGGRASTAAGFFTHFPTGGHLQRRLAGA